MEETPSKLELWFQKPLTTKQRLGVVIGTTVGGAFMMVAFIAALVYVAISK